MGQRAIGLLEKENEKYDAHYTHWLPIEESEYNFSEEEPLGGIFRENTIVEGIDIKQAKEIAKSHGASLVVIINSEYNFEIKETSNL